MPTNDFKPAKRQAPHTTTTTTVTTINDGKNGVQAMHKLIEVSANLAKLLDNFCVWR